MRWITVFVLAVSLGTVLGCKQPCFMSKDDFDHYHDMGAANLEHDPTASVIAAVSEVKAPPTINDPERQIRYLTLAEAIATALEQGTVGIQNFFISLNRSNTNNYNNENLVTFNGRSIGFSDSIRVLALQPAIVASDIEAALAKFDARWVSSATWNTTDQPVANALQTIQALGQNVIIQDNATVSSAVIKPLPTGGVAGITFNTQYQQSNLRQRLNPSYQPNLTFSFEQPLLQGYGVEINQLRTTHPGSILNPFSVGGRVEGILITRIRFDEQRAEFERNLNYMLGNVELAYWELYGSYWTLYSREAGLRQAYEAWKINKARYEAGRIPVQDLAQSRLQYELFRGQRLTALADVLERERQIRGLMGLPIEDGTRLVPVDAPTLSPFNPDWHTAVNESLANRPELILARNDLKFRQLDLINQKNLLLPDVRFISSYGITGIGNRLDSPDATNAFRSLASNQFSNWTLGVQANVPIGFRDANAAVRAARLNLAQAYAVLKDQENKAMRFLQVSYRNIFENYEQIKIQRAQREAAAIQLDARFKEFLAGRGTLDILLEAQRLWADSLQAEYANVVLYNKALVSFDFARGTILQRDNVVISEGPLPKCAQIRAVQHEQERCKALVCRERAAANKHGACDGLSVPGMTSYVAPSLPSLPELPNVLKDKPALPEVSADKSPASHDLDDLKTAPIRHSTGLSDKIALPKTSPMPSPEPSENKPASTMDAAEPTNPVGRHEDDASSGDVKRGGYEPIKDLPKLLPNAPEKESTSSVNPTDPPPLKSSAPAPWEEQHEEKEN